MKSKLRSLVAYILFATPTLLAQTTTFTYQGRLNHAGAPASGLYEMSFVLYDAVSNGQAVGLPITVAPVPVTNGLFTAALDFGAGAFMGANRWLEISVTVFGSDQPVVTLVPRQPLTPTPYALHAYSAANLMSGGNAPVEIKVNGQRGLRLEYVTNENWTGVNVVAGSSGNVVSEGVVGATISGGGAATGVGVLINKVAGDFATVGGGGGNTASGESATVAGGTQNTSSGQGATIGGGTGNTNTGWRATIGGGYLNRVEAGAWWATIAGGVENTIKSGVNYGTIGGGAGNSIHGTLVGYPTISGGFMNSVLSARGTISGGERNTVQTNSEYATIAGGTSNTAAARGAAIGGGSSNTNNGYSATIGGGYQNVIQPTVQYATISGGLQNVVHTNAWHGTISGGAWNAALGPLTAIGGGSYNAAAGGQATISGGSFNVASGEGAAVPGGSGNRAVGHYSFAAGHDAKATHNGAFVWGDWTFADIASTNDNSVTFRASGGVRIFSNSGATAGAFLAPGSGAWSSLSDRNAKENFTRANGREVLDKVAALPMTSWNYKAQDKSVRHLGPIAQDFHAAFGLGESDRTITTVDADGVALAAIQGLNQKLEESLKQKETEITELKKRVEQMERLLTMLAKNSSAR